MMMMMMMMMMIMMMIIEVGTADLVTAFTSSPAVSPVEIFCLQMMN